MRACVLTDVSRLELRELPPPTPSRREILLRVAAVGLCGTDFHIFEGHANYNMDAQGRPRPLRDAPQILGHEIAGVVEELGGPEADACGLRPGDRVIVDQGINCASAARDPRCEYCTSGDSHQCEHYGELGITGLPGGFSELLALPAVNAWAVRAPLDLAEAALAEPLACVVHAVDTIRRAAARFRLDAAGDRAIRSVLLLGAGPAGLLFTQYLRRVVGFDGLLLVSEPNPRRRALAAAFGADVIDPAAVDLVDTVATLTKGRGAELLVDVAGVGALYAQVPGLLRKQGTFVLYAHGQHGADLGLLDRIKFKEPTFVSPCGGSGPLDEAGRPSSYRQALDLLEQGRVQAAPLLTHRYAGLGAVPEAFAGDHRRPDYVKGVVVL